jgi:hypothetical protein
MFYIQPYGEMTGSIKWEKKKKELQSGYSVQDNNMTQHFLVFEEIRWLQNPWNSSRLSSVHCAVAHSIIEGHMINIEICNKKILQKQKRQSNGMM